MDWSLRAQAHSRAIMQSQITGVIPRAKLGPSWVNDLDKPIYHVSARSGWLNVSAAPGLCLSHAPAHALARLLHACTEPNAAQTVTRTPTAQSSSTGATTCASLTSARCRMCIEHALALNTPSALGAAQVLPAHRRQQRLGMAHVLGSRLQPGSGHVDSRADGAATYSRCGHAASTY